MFSLNPRRRTELQEVLSGWFLTNGRSLPWREHRTVYGTWIAEVMLQQTTVQVVQPFWERFMTRFPDVQSLAGASEEEVLALWSGLGYYRRARFLHRAARQIAAGGGTCPDSPEGWARLPGVGSYTSGAIASMALGFPVPAVDANARRVLTRWLVGDPRELAGLKPGHLEKVARQLVPAREPGRWNEAVMELGALVCRAGQVDCTDCPVLHLCRTGLAGVSGEVPAPGERVQVQPVQAALLVVRRDDQVLLVPPASPPLLEFPVSRRVVRSDLGGLHQGLWGLPTTVWAVPERTAAVAKVSIGDELGKWLNRNGYRPAFRAERPLLSVGRFRHFITRYRLLVDVFLLDLPQAYNLGSARRSSSKETLWKNHKGEFPRFSAKGLQNIAVSNLARKALQLVGDNFG